MPFDETVQHTRALYIDLECLCWDGPAPPGMKQDIIEIGVVEMDLGTLQIVQESSYFIRPKRWEISSKCTTQLTGIVREDILTARSFSEVLTDIAEKFRPAATPCCAWGNDHSLLSIHCDLMRVRNPFKQPIDLCKVFKGLIAARQTLGLGDAVTMLGLKFEGVPHGALPDARNTARVHAAMMSRMHLEPSSVEPAIVTRVAPVPLSPFARKLAQSLGSVVVNSVAEPS